MTSRSAATIPYWGTGRTLLGHENRFLPLKLTVVYVLGTFMLFLMSPNRADVVNLPVLITYVLLATLALCVGYILSVVQKRTYRMHGTPDLEPSRLNVGIIVASSAWFLVFGMASLSEYGATNVQDVIRGVLNPGESYFSKFNVYAEQQRTGRVNVPLQAAVLTGALFSALIPLVLLYWKSLSLPVRLFAVVGVAVFLLYFGFIGTQKGFGDVLIMVLASLLAVVGLKSRENSKPSVQLTPKKKKKRQLRVAAAVLVIGFVAMLATVQGDRIEGLSTRETYEPVPIVADVFGEKFARGLTVAMFYPTHGYVGLSKSLSQPFEFSGGASAPALASYKVQYLGGEDPMAKSYPARAEAATGWPAGQVWSTVLPWLASDLTFPGTLIFVAAFGWFLARTWLGVRRELDPLSLVIFCQLAIAVLYIPANNQLMLSRYTAIGSITLLALYALRPLFPSRRSIEGLN